MFFEKRQALFIGRFAPWFRSATVACAFSTRRGGVSLPPYDSLNLGLNTEDDAASVGENLRRFCDAAGVDRERIAFTKQVHGVRVATARSAGVVEDTDALVSDAPGLWLAIQTADCVPIFLFDPVRKAVAAVNAGWKGSLDGIAEMAVRAMDLEFGTKPADLEACIGPSIGPCCYRIGPEVDGLFPQEYIKGNRLDLWEYNHVRLIRSGVCQDRIQMSRLCTVCHNSWFFSHLASQGKTGRMMALISIPENP